MTANMKPTKKAAASAARERGEDRFLWPCKTHGEHPHYASSSSCVACQRERAGKRWNRTRSDPEARASHNERQRAAMARLREQPGQRAKDINSAALGRLRGLGRPKTAMPTTATLKQCLQIIEAAPEGADLDHAIPLKGVHPISGEWVVSGLHTPYNLEPMLPRSNKRKSHYFDPENPLEFQKPYNSFPGGQFYGGIGEIEFMRYTTPTTLELMTVDEYEALFIQTANEECDKACA
ncbi:hypothetical protein [Caballeronia sp. GAFFF1]|uniref:hypothetical protein n=1 Tax=Caballeronia sp. GAFFF1 TaxID=2921779 RepID=UPI002029464C|nr:hypothetical protein [Caballeronia sp. GAFFF1]